MGTILKEHLKHRDKLLISFAENPYERTQAYLLATAVRHKRPNIERLGFMIVTTFKLHARL
jgi:hypothetical protein